MSDKYYKLIIDFYAKNVEIYESDEYGKNTKPKSIHLFDKAEFDLLVNKKNKKKGKLTLKLDLNDE